MGRERSHNSPVELICAYQFKCNFSDDAGKRINNADSSRKLSAVAAGHTMQAKKRHFEPIIQAFFGPDRLDRAQV